MDLTRRLAGRVTLVTGASGGIGQATVARLAAEGALVAASDLTAPDLPAAALTLALDVTRPGAWEAAIAQVQDRLGPLDILINGAGLAIAKDIETTTPEELRRSLAINLEGPFFGLQAGIAAMKRRSAPHDGVIVSLASIAGQVAAVPLAAYGAAKAGLVGATKTAAIHCAEAGYPIRAVALCPGFVETGMLSGIAGSLGDTEAMLGKLARRQPNGRLGTPEEVAAAIAFLVSDDARAITGEALIADGGFVAR
ncbi:SDR family NAD(P)-dependent oxidoreductase [Algihabitans albus]|uniref:SDR family NAD(P)-dependent oxidoreductase n=1 Tax=Algihabitans albus TaxID=2164067 RepID=UPI000E5C57F7|nr:SDR family oxidoreductase [Algihabitans albus]